MSWALEVVMGAIANGAGVGGRGTPLAPNVFVEMMAQNAKNIT
jgi:hypothetical protein